MPTNEHGWERTPELHLLADTSSTLLMAAVALVALSLALTPCWQRRSPLPWDERAPQPEAP